MTTPTQTVETFLDALARHDVDAAMALVDSQAAVTVHPFGLHDKGADVLRTVLADLERAFPDLMVTVSRVIATGDVVTALFKAEGTQSADYAGAINQEKHLDIDQAWRFVAAGGAGGAGGPFKTGSPCLYAWLRTPRERGALGVSIRAAVRPRKASPCADGIASLPPSPRRNIIF